MTAPGTALETLAASASDAPFSAAGQVPGYGTEGRAVAPMLLATGCEPGATCATSPSTDVKSGALVGVALGDPSVPLPDGEPLLGDEGLLVDEPREDEAPPPPEDDPPLDESTRAPPDLIWPSAAETAAPARLSA